jgi:hypothetical protein
MCNNKYGVFMIVTGFKILGILLLYIGTFTFYFGCDNSLIMPSACNNIVYTETWGQFENKSTTPIKIGYNSTTAMRDICYFSKTLDVLVVSERIKFERASNTNIPNTSSTINFGLLIAFETVLLLIVVSEFIWFCAEYRQKKNAYVEVS